MNSEHEHGIGKEHPYSHLIQLNSPIVFLVIWGMDSFIFKLSEDVTRPIPLVIRVFLFFMTLLLAVVLIKASHDAVFNRKDESPSLVTTGVYSYIRHPMYLGILLIYPSLIFLTASFISIIPWIIIFLLYNKIAAYEEKDLERILKQEYTNYKKRVARWIPKTY